MVSINATSSNVDASMEMQQPPPDINETDTMETMNYLSLAGMAPEEEYPVDRSRSIFELIDERK